MEDERFHFFFAMGFVQEEEVEEPDLLEPNEPLLLPKKKKKVRQITAQLHDGSDVIVRVASVLNGAVLEMLMAVGVSNSFVCKDTKSVWSETEWAQFIGKYVDGHIIRVQTVFPVTCDSTGASCVERLIQKNIMETKLTFLTNNGAVLFDDQIEVDPELLNCYRAASGGRMHHLDTRPWLMTNAKRFEMESEMRNSNENLLQLTRDGVEVRFIFYMIMMKYMNVYENIHLRTDANAQVGLRIRQVFNTIECARNLMEVSAQGGIFMTTHMQVISALESAEMELHELEGQEMDIFSAADALETMISRHGRVLRFQSVLDAQMRLDDKNDLIRHCASSSSSSGRKRQLT